MAKQTVSGPYHVVTLGYGSKVYEVIRDNGNGTTSELIPRKTYLKRESAYAKMVRLNRRWQEDHWMDEALDAELEALNESDPQVY